MSRKVRANELLPPHGVHALVPVLAASGGAGRSTVAGLLAQAFALATRTSLIDPSPRAVSPWADWLGVGIARAEAAGLTGLASPYQELDGPTVLAASTRRLVPLGKLKKGDLPAHGVDAKDGIGYDVLADTRPWTRPPVAVPEDPRWYARLAELGGWVVSTVDVGVPIVAAHLAARAAVRQSLLDAWMRRQDTVPVLTTAANGFGAAVLVRLVSALEQDGISTQRMVVAVVNTAGSDPPRWMHTELEKLSGRVAAVVEFPHDKAIRHDGLARLDDIGSSTLDAARTIGRTIAKLVRPHHDDGPPDEPYVFQTAGAAGPTADPGAPTGERYRHDQPHTPAPHTPAPPAPQPTPEPKPQVKGWVPDRRG